MSRPAILGAVALLVAGALALVVLRDEPAKQARPDAPNVIVIMTDDQAMNAWSREVMPRTFERFRDDGTFFRQNFAVPPLCCPARASFMTGRYPHNHGVLTNNYKSISDEEDVLPVWLSEAGYETMIAGKFLNGYERVPGPEERIEPAPGWDRWWVAVGEERKYFDYDVSVDGELEPYGSGREDYVTNALTTAAVDFMKAEADDEGPYFLWMAHAAPHFASRERTEFCPERKGALPLPGDYRDAADAELPTPPSFYEENVEDKPGFIRRLEPRRPIEVRTNQRTYRCTVAALAAVDRSVETVFKTLEETGELDDTLVFFTSDNGAFLGEHRKREGKKLPYDPAARVPLAVKWPGGRAPSSSDAQTGLIDIAPTILELAGLEGEHRMDGRSLTAALRRKGSRWPRDRGIVLEIGKAEKCLGYHALRTPDYLFTEYRRETEEECAVGATELYDLRKDPYMLRNLLGVAKVGERDRVLAKKLSARLADVNACSGVRGRDPATDAPFCE